MNHVFNGACKLCHRVLDWEVDGQGRNGHWVHTTQDRTNEDHAPVWAPEDAKTAYRCDFCNINEPTFILPCGDFVVPIPGRQDKSVGEWLACGYCAPFLSADEWEMVIERAIAVSPSFRASFKAGVMTHSDARGFLTRLYGEIRTHQQGPLTPWSRPM